MALYRSQSSPPSILVGCGFKPQHWHYLEQNEVPIRLFEVHAENYLVAGGPFLHHLNWLRNHYEISLHGVGMSIGGAEIDISHLKAIADLVHRVEPLLFSEHLAWSSYNGKYFNDLLPLPYHQESLKKISSHIHQIQDMLKRPLLLENPSSYLSYQDSCFTEAEFLSEIVKTTGCALLLDVNNVYVSCVNLQLDPYDYLDHYPIQQVKEIHLAGFANDLDSAGNLLLIDDHGAAVAQPVWDLYRYTLQLIQKQNEKEFNFSPTPTIVERDNHIPSLEIIVQEALMAEKIQMETFAPIFTHQSLEVPINYHL